ncbi:MAG: hypothetical protein Q8Q04_02130 [archaeon]|nr:hypothetical protein [archaeon]
MRFPERTSKKGLIIPVKFAVLDAKYFSIPVFNVDPISKNFSGVVSHAKIKVENEEGVPTSELNFYGINPGIYSGDYIRAYIHKYSGKNEEYHVIEAGEFNKESFFERDFRKKETVSKIEKWSTLTCDGKLLGTFFGLERHLVKRYLY